MAIKVPIRIRGDKSSTGLEAERVFDSVEWFLLYSKNINSLKIIIARSLEEKDLNYIDWLVLKTISTSKDELTVSEVAFMFDLSFPQTTLLLKKLAKKSLVRQKVSPKDRRVKYLKCTRKGNKLVFEVGEAIQHAMRYWLFDLSDNELKEFHIILKKINSFEIPPINFS